LNANRPSKEVIGIRPKYRKQWLQILAACLSAWALACVSGGALAAVVDIRLPAEVSSFKQAPGAELANGQCLVCHSVEYISIQPPMPRAFWKASVQKMQQKYGASIPEELVEPLADYLVVNYGIATNISATPQPKEAAPATKQSAVDGKAVAMKYGCFGCHNTTAKLVGPAYHEVAAKYKSDPEAVSKIEQQIHKGGSGKWGPIIMPPFPQIAAEETKALTDWILATK
jgi:cytochrome c551/c552